MLINTSTRFMDSVRFKFISKLVKCNVKSFHIYWAFNIEKFNWMVQMWN